jgi:predicted kinase
MKTVFIMRGAAGSGKSSWVRENCSDPLMYVVSADDFWMETHFIREEGVDGGEVRKTEVYRFDIKRLAESHQDCLCRFIDAVVEGYDEIVVDNTNIRKWQYAPYVKIAKAYGYEVKIIEFRPVTLEDVRTCVRRNIHDVPEETVIRMCVDFEPDEEAFEVLKISS